MAVRETLELDIRRALAQANELGAAYEARLKAAGQGLDQGIAGTTGNLKAGADAAGSIGTGLRAAGQEATRAAVGVGQVGVAGRDAAAGFVQLGPAADKAAADLYGYQLAQRKTKDEERQSNEEHRKSAESLKRVGVAAGIAGAAVAAGLGIAFNASMDFDQQLSMLGAVSDATSSQMGKLRTAALDAGAATVFSAKDAALAETELAKAGVSVGDILGGGLLGAMNLASAGQLELGRAAEIAAQTMTMFGLAGRDVNHIADVLAAGANKSTGSVESLGQGLENVGGIAAKLFNISLEETVGTLALLDQNAVRGAEGGTALKSALLSLATPTDKQTAAMKAVNLEVYDAQGNFVGLSKLAGNLQTAFAGATDEQRNLALGIIFGTYGIKAANVLYGEGEAGVREWTAAVNDQGAAQRFASKALDNLSGDLEQLRGSIETGLIGAGSQANGVLRFMAQRATEAANGLVALPGPVQAGAVGLAALSAAGLLAVSAAGTLIPKYQQVQESLRGTGVAGKFAADNMGTMLKVAAGAAVAVTSFQMIGQSAESSAIGIGGMAAAGATIGSVFPVYGTAIGAAAGFTIGLGKAMLGSSDAAGVFSAKVAGLAAELGQLGAKGAANRFVESTFDSMGFAADHAGARVAGLMQNFNELARTSPAAARRVLDGLKDLRDENGKPFVNEAEYTKLETMLGKGEVAYAKATQNAKDNAAANLEVAGSLDVTGAAAEESAKAWEDYVGALSAGTPTITGVFEEAAGAVKDWQDANSPEQLLENLQKQLDAVSGFHSNVQFLYDAGLTNLGALVAEKGPIAGAALAQALRDAEPETLGAMNATVAGIGTELDGLNSDIAGKYAEASRNSAYGLGFGVGTGATGGMNAAAPQTTGAAQSLASAAAAAFGIMPGIGYDAGYNTGIGMRDGLDASKASVWASASDMAAGVWDRVAGVLQFGSPSKRMRQAGRWTGEGFALGILDKEQRVAGASARLGAMVAPGIAVARGLAGGLAVGGGSSSSSTEINVNAQTNASAVDIAREIAWRQRFGGN